jgi:hypothetical protein
MRPLKYGEEMTQINIRVPKSKVKDIQKLVSDYLIGFDNGGGLTKFQVNDMIVLGKAPKLEIPVIKPKWQLDAEKRNKRGSE